MNADALMLSSNRIAGHLLNHALGPVLVDRRISKKLAQQNKMKTKNSHVTKRNHANGLPHAQSNTGSDATVETLDTVGPVNVPEGVADRHLLGTVRVFLLALHLDSNDLDGLVPGGQTTTDTTGNDLLRGAQLLAVLLASDVTNTLLGETRQTETAAPVGHLTNGDGVDTLVDTLDTLLAVNVGKGGPGGGRLAAGGDDLVLGDLNGLHASAEAHGGIGLRHTTRHATRDAAKELGRAGSAGIVLGLGGNEEEHGALGGSLDPSPGNQTLVEAEDATTGPDAAQGGHEAVATVGSHGGLDDLKRLAEGGDLEHVEAGSEEQVGELDRLLLQLLLRKRSRHGGDGGHDDGGELTGGGPDQGKEGASSLRLEWEKRRAEGAA